jgi:putative endonuclease
MARRPRVPVEEWRDPRHRLGIRGEELAIDYLAGCGWSILAHRFRLGRHDLDLVVRLDNLVAFVEVKTRTGHEFGAGAEAIGWRKRRTLGRLAEVWRARYGAPADLYRFDVIEVHLYPRQPPEIHHLADAWRITT